MDLNRLATPYCSTSASSSSSTTGAIFLAAFFLDFLVLTLVSTGLAGSSETGSIAGFLKTKTERTKMITTKMAWMLSIFELAKMKNCD